MSNERPILIFDGDCGFCRYWVRYWERLTGPRVHYAAYQDVADHYPEIPEEAFARSIQWIDDEGNRFSGAHAAFQVMAKAPDKRCWLWLYHHIPGVAPVAEWSYDIISRHRVTAAKVSRALWGAELYPEHFVLVGWAFLRLIALIYLAAFGSLSVQITGLVGAEGILPAAEYLPQAHGNLGSVAYWQIPTVFWLDSSDRALQVACWTGMASAAAVFFGVFVRTGLILCYVLYLSMVYAGQTFLEFQWDMLLLESGFLALFLPFGSRILVWLYRWLLFRFMFMGGVVKLASGDPRWRDLTALRYHLETQPLPSPLAWYAYQLPDALLQVATASVLVIELLVPFVVFLPRNPRLVAAASFLLLQSGIMLTGNYNFFNLLTIALCVFLLDDRDIRPCLGARLASWIEQRAQPASVKATASAAAMAFVSLSVCSALLWMTNTHRRPFQPLEALVQLTATFGIVNGYGPFAVMTTERREIVVEGSADGRTWLPYEFEYKPGGLAKPLRWNIPHQPRLDWQMWFAALGDPRTATWFPKFVARLETGSAPVLALLQSNPFFDQPPRHVRASLYRYSFVPPEVNSSTGQVWQRELLGSFQPAR